MTTNLDLSPPPSGPPDEEIIARVLRGERRLFELLMRRYNQRVFRAARAIVRSDDEAEDVMQDAYVRAFEHLAQFGGRARFSTWLTRIAVHEALARVRKQGRFSSFESQPEESPSMVTRSPSSSPEQQASDGEMRHVLEHAIDALPDDFRAVFVLRTIEEMSGAETAECLGIPEETVKTRLFRARTRLQEMLLGSLEPKLQRAYAFHLSRCDRVVAAVLRRVGVNDGVDDAGEPPRSLDGLSLDRR